MGLMLMELMINYSEILTVIIQSLLISIVCAIFVGCLEEIAMEIRKVLKKKKGVLRVREYTCPVCGFKAWALDSIVHTNCRQCGTAVVTKPIPKVKKENSFMYDLNDRTRKTGYF